MRSVFNDPVEYYLPIGDVEVPMNSLIGSEIEMEYLGEIHCIKCGRKTSKSFFQGYCYPCYTTAPETEECVLRPELCRAHLGEARDMDFASKYCLIDQVVYLSLTSGIKVGVTRSTQVPFRWIDQGAVRAVELARAPNRYTAGLIEVQLKTHMKDSTNWRAMLKNEIHFDGDLLERKQAALKLLPDDLRVFGSDDDHITTINYPVSAYPEKVGSLNFEKESVISGKISGLKGQYLLFENNRVINLRKFGGYKVRFSYG